MSSSNKQKNKVIFCDNLEVSLQGYVSPNFIADEVGVKGKIRKINSNCYVEFTNHKNYYFKNVVNLWIDTQLIGEFRYNPSCPFVPKDLINFKLENSLLYQKDFPSYIDEIIKIFHLNYLYVSHLGIAADCVDHDIIPFVNKYSFYSNALNYSIKRKGKLDIRNITTDNCTTIHWGSIKSVKYITVYDKTLEYSDNNCSKPYIPRAWKENNMNVENKIVERLELTLKQKHAKKLDYRKLTDCNYLASILETHCLNYFQFIKTIKNNKKTYKKDVTPIAFDEFNTELLPKFKHIKNTSLHNEKIELKSLYFQYLLADLINQHPQVQSGEINPPEYMRDSINYYKTIENIVSTYPILFDYFNNKKTPWHNEFNRTNELSLGIKSIYEYIRISELTKLSESEKEIEHGVHHLKIVSNSTDEEYNPIDEEITNLNNVNIKPDKKKYKKFLLATTNKLIQYTNDISMLYNKTHGLNSNINTINKMYQMLRNVS